MVELQMKQIMSELHLDHQHIRALLTILKNKLATLEGSGRPDFNLMSEVMDYLEDFAVGFHHVREGLLFSFVRVCHPQANGLIDLATKEHQALTRLTASLRESVEQVLQGRTFMPEGFVGRLSRYIDKQGQHLSFEEGRLYPLIEQLMAPQDWQQFSAQLPPRDDPLQASWRDDRYRRLYDSLIEDLV